MSFGGHLGLGESFPPLPWSTLKDDSNQGGYVVHLSKKLLEGAPNYDRNSEFKWTSEYSRKVDDFYNAPSYWI